MMLTANANLISALHAHPARWVLAMTGGGASAAGELLRVPGGSRTLLEIIVPYHEQALAEYLGYWPETFCSEATSQALADKSQARARWLVAGQAAFGLGCTASLVSDRPKRGDHRIHISTVGGAALHTWTLTLTKGARDRDGEECVAARLILAAMAHTLGIPAPAVDVLPGEQIQATTVPAKWPPSQLAKSGTVLMEADGRLRAAATWDAQRPSVLVPGAFNPLHAAHIALAEVAERLTGMPAAYELSVTNVDKPELPNDEVRRRLDQFVGLAPVWLTRAPRFADKAKLFPGAAFAIGADTALRLVDARYHENDEQRLQEALRFIRDQGCRFLVAGRADAAGGYVGIEDISIPADYRDLFGAIPADAFHMDISSTKLRAARDLG